MPSRYRTFWDRHENRPEAKIERQKKKCETLAARRTRTLRPFNGYTHDNLWWPLMELVEKRKRMGLSQSDVAETMGVSRQFVSRLETSPSEPADSPALREPSFSVLRKYAEALGYDLRIALLEPQK